MSKQAKQQIEDILNIPCESLTVEFKRLTGTKVVSKIIQTIVAMANTSGGKIFLGINDPERMELKGHDRILGIEEDPENFDQLIAEFKNIRPLPPVSPDSITEILDPVSKKTVAVIDIPKSTEHFHSFGQDTFVVRGRKGNRILTYQEYADMRYAKGFVKADQELIDNVLFELLDTEWFADWRKSRQISGGVKDVLVNAGLARADQKTGDILPTRAAVLLFAQMPDSLMTDARCAIRIFRYRGNHIDYGANPNLISNAPSLEGPVVKVIEDAHRAVLEVLAEGVVVKSGFETQYKIPSRVIKEAITNAVIHRDYHQSKNIEIRIYQDRLEVVNPGMFASNITLGNIGKERALGYRNGTLVRQLVYFSNNPNLDANEGVRAMIKEMENNGLYPPVYSTWPTPDETGLRYYVKLKLHYEEATPEWSPVKAYLADHKFITNPEARQVAGVKQSDRMSRLLKHWSDKGLLERINGDNKSLRDYKYQLRVI